MKLNNTINKSCLLILSLLLVGTAGGLLLAKVTPLGIGIYSDSVMYISLARNLMQGQGWTIDGAPVTTYPPLYPLVLASAKLFSANVIAVARWFQIIAFSCNIVWMGLITYRLTERSWKPALLISLFTLGSVDIISYHSIALTEGLFLFFSLPGFLFLLRYTETSSYVDLTIGSVLLSLACLTRYAGLAWIGGGAIFLFLFSNKSWPQKIINVVLFSIIGYGPSFLWVLRNLRYETAMGRHFDVHPFFGKPELQSLLMAFASWTGQRSIGFLLAACLSCVLLGWFFVIRSVRMTESIKKRFLLIQSMIFLYLLLLVVSAGFFQADMFRDSTRILIPIHLLVLILIFTQADCWIRIKSLQSQSIFYGCLLGIFLLYFAKPGFLWASYTSRDGQGYSCKQFRESALIKAVGQLSSQINLYTNLDSPVILYTGKNPTVIPAKVDNDTQCPNAHYADEMKAMAADIKDGAYLIFFNQGDSWYSLPSLDEINQIIPLQSILKVDDGTIYRAAD